MADYYEEQRLRDEERRREDERRRYEDQRREEEERRRIQNRQSDHKQDDALEDRRLEFNHEQDRYYDQLNNERRKVQEEKDFELLRKGNLAGFAASKGWSLDSFFKKPDPQPINSTRVNPPSSQSNKEHVQNVLNSTIERRNQLIADIDLIIRSLDPYHSTTPLNREYLYSIRQKVIMFNIYSKEELESFKIYSSPFAAAFPSLEFSISLFTLTCGGLQTAIWLDGFWDERESRNK